MWDIERGVPVAELSLLGCGISVAQCENVVAIGMGTPINYVTLWDIRTKNTRELGPRLVIFQILSLLKLNLPFMGTAICLLAENSVSMDVDWHIPISLLLSRSKS